MQVEEKAEVIIKKEETEISISEKDVSVSAPTVILELDRSNRQS